jgi:hypothetical protein
MVGTMRHELEGGTNDEEDPGSSGLLETDVCGRKHTVKREKGKMKSDEDSHVDPFLFPYRNPLIPSCLERDSE